MQHARDGNRWRKSVGCSIESEPVSFQNNNIGCSHSPDVSPVLCKSGKKVALKHISPKVKKKSLKMLADVRTPMPSSSSNVDKCEAAVADGKQPRALFQNSSPINAPSKASGETDLSQSAQTLPDPGQFPYNLNLCLVFQKYSYSLSFFTFYAVTTTNFNFYFFIGCLCEKH